MNRYVTEQLLTVEEAQRLSGYDNGYGRDERKEREKSIWSWQTVAGALDQHITDEQVEQMARLRRR
jgi:hypothetical protein